MPCKADIINRILDGCSEARQPFSEAFAPANIALSKYWGKRDPDLNLPVTDSVSIALGSLGTRCRLSWSGTGEDRISLNGETLAPAHPAARRISAFLDLTRNEPGDGYDVETVNTVPTAAGFASSASGFAALALALDRLRGWHLDGRRLSILARLGSGSACRSLWQGFVYWHAGVADDGMDSFAVPLPVRWPDLRIALLMLTSAAKPVGSTEAMRRTVETSGLYPAWPAKVAADLADIRRALETRDLPLLGETAESNALAMHATLFAARPPVVYWTPASLEAIERVWAARRDGIPVYFTMDAGPNLKLLFPETASVALHARFPELRIAGPPPEEEAGPS